MMMTLLSTLAPHGSHPDLTVLPADTRAVLQRLADMPEVKLHFCSLSYVLKIKQLHGVRIGYITSFVCKNIFACSVFCSDIDQSETSIVKLRSRSNLGRTND